MELLEEEVKKVIELIKKHGDEEEFWENFAERLEETVDCDFWVSEGWCCYPDQLDGLVLKVKFFYDPENKVTSEEDAEKTEGIVLCTNCLSWSYSKNERIGKRLEKCCGIHVF